MCLYSNLFLSNEDNQEELPFTMPGQGRRMTKDKAADNDDSTNTEDEGEEEESGEDEEMGEEKEDGKGKGVLQETEEEEEEKKEEKEPKWIKVYKIDPPTPPVGANDGNPFEEEIGEFVLRDGSSLADVAYAIHGLWADYTKNRKGYPVVYGNLENAWPGYHVKFYAPLLEETEVEEELENHDNVVLGFVTVTKGQNDQPERIPIFLETFDRETGVYKPSEAPISFLPLSGAIPLIVLRIISMTNGISISKLMRVLDILSNLLLLAKYRENGKLEELGNSSPDIYRYPSRDSSD